MKKTLIIAAAVLGLVSCSKEKKLESRLDNQEWNIDQLKTEVYIGGVLQPGQVCTKDNAGSFKLDKGGVGSAGWEECGITRDYTITSWTVGVDSLKIAFKDNKTQGAESWDFLITKNEKKTQEWSRVTKQGNFETRSILKLSRKK